MTVALDPNTALARGKALSEQVMPGLHEALDARYSKYVPGLPDWLVSSVWGGVYARDGLDMKTRQLATLAALTALGGQTRPQLKVHVGAALEAGATPQEISEVILQMALYGGFPAMVNALNAAIEVFDEKDVSP